MADIPTERRAALSVLITHARNEKGWSQIELADQATMAVDGLAEAMESAGVAAAAEEIAAWEGLEITRHHVWHLENCPVRPLHTHERRGRLLAVCLALGVSRDRVNRLAGGI